MDGFAPLERSSPKVEVLGISCQLHWKLRHKLFRGDIRNSRGLLHSSLDFPNSGAIFQWSITISSNGTCSKFGTYLIRLVVGIGACHPLSHEAEV